MWKSWQRRQRIVISQNSGPNYSSFYQRVVCPYNFPSLWFALTFLSTALLIFCTSSIICHNQQGLEHHLLMQQWQWQWWKCLALTILVFLIALVLLTTNRANQFEKEITEETEEMQKVQFLPFWMPAGWPNPSLKWIPMSKINRINSM